MMSLGSADRVDLTQSLPSIPSKPRLGVLDGGNEKYHVALAVDCLERYMGREMIYR
jgi:hypothetical protein